MKFGKSVLIILFLALSGGSFIEAKHTPGHQKECKCYCSYECGPRYPDHPGDAPFIDQETGICFCQERDRKAYFKHGCDKYNNAKNFKSCCDQQLMDQD